MESPRAVFLDVGWTLTYPCESMWEAFAEICREAGSRLTAEDAERHVHGLMMSRRRLAVEELESGAEYPDSDEDFLTIFLSVGSFVFELAGLRDNYAALTGRFLERFWDRANWAIFPDVVPTLERLRARGIRVGVISNASSEMVQFLKKIDLFPYFDLVCVSAIEGARKPDSRIFQWALQRAGVAPGEAIHVGDMFLEDVLGAVKAGIRPFLIDRGARRMFPHHPETVGPGGQQVVQVVQGLEELLDAVGID